MIKFFKLAIIFYLFTNFCLAKDILTKKSFSIYDDPEAGYNRVIIQDPFEPLNRRIHSFNKAFDKYLLFPVTSLYERSVPKIGRVAVDNALSNLNEPISMINHALQLDLYNTLTTFWRFFFNITLGVLGTNDFAGKYLDLQENKNNFETTLAKYCFNHGPYLMLPILGPNTIRGGVGKAVDIFGDPLNFAFSGEDWNKTWLTGKSVLNIINFRSTHKGLFDDLNNLSADDYAMIKSIYSQKIYNRDLRYKYCNK